MRGFILTFSIAALLVSAPAAAQSLPDWMAGCWVQTEGEEWTEECWTSPRAGIMLGSSRTGEGENLRLWETMQMVANQEFEDEPVWPLALWASPLGEERTMFRWIASDAPGVSFINPGNDYPQRIRYWREEGTLNAEISMLDGSRRRQWSYRAMKSGD